MHKDSSYDRGKSNLGEVSASWPTPNASLMNDGEKPETFLARQKKLKDKSINGNGAGVPLTVACRQMPGLQDPKQTGAQSQSTSGPRLNPNFVEWLMGFPEGWTVCEPSATLSSRSKQHSPSGSSSQGSNDD